MNGSIGRRRDGVGGGGDEYNNNASKMYEMMDDGLQNVFFQCYKRYGKVSTKKLVSCFEDPIIKQVTNDIIQLSHNGIDIPLHPVPTTTTTKSPSSSSTSKERFLYGITTLSTTTDDDENSYEGDDDDDDDDGWELVTHDLKETATMELMKCPQWLNDLKIGPGVSPCVNATCGNFLHPFREEGEGRVGEGEGLEGYGQGISFSSKVDCLTYFRELCGTACELCVLIHSHRIDLQGIITDARKKLEEN